MNRALPARSARVPYARVQLGFCALGLLLLLSLTAAGCDAFNPDLVQGHGPLSPPPTMDGGSMLGDGGLRDGGVIIGRPDGSTADECTDNDSRCDRDHALTACVRGQCVLVECEPPWVDCDGDSANGCEATLDSLDNCGLCLAACELPGAVTSCSDQQCAFVSCDNGFGDCDQDTQDGCETALDSIANCGSCGHGCDALPQAAPGCIEHACGIGECLGPYGDCDHDADNGCEEPLASSEHCGACDSPCAPPSAAGSCDTGQCAITSCDGDSEDCDGLVADGCEASLDSIANCGACGQSCELPLHATAVLCSGTHACGVDHGCPAAASGCVEDAPETGCEDGFADCDGEDANGCETRLGTLSDCGGCDDACDAPNAISSCDGGGCISTECAPGYGNCGGSGCTWLGDDEAHCGACGTACTGGDTCVGGKCTDQVCAADTADCTADAGCETATNAVPSCGQCDLDCGPYAHASATCTGSRCAIDHCDAGFLDCDGYIYNGCEADAHTAEICGACNAVCSIPHALESCETGVCDLVGCDPGRADCNDDIADGCETSTLLPNHCGSCDNDCTGRPHSLSGGCSEGVCEIVCADGYRDCDGDIRNGCEAQIGSAEHCGSCENDCTALDHVTDAACADAVCTGVSCDPGFGDCDGLTSTGCERPTNTETDCGGCDTRCELPHASASCSNSGSCRLTDCDPGYADCNGEPTDGCESSLNDPATCGTCEVACGTGLACANGQCSCTTSDQCGDLGLECCDGLCVDTASACSLWPCPIPGTARPLPNCGGCGVDCTLSAAFFCCATL